MSNRRSGTVFFKVDGVRYDVRGSFTYNLGAPKRETMVGHDAVHGYKELPQAPFIEGEITDARDLDLAKFLALDGATATLEIANGKTIVLRDAWMVTDGNVQTENGNIQVRLEGMSAEEVV